jgi:hypothetical protein
VASGSNWQGLIGIQQATVKGRGRDGREDTMEGAELLLLVQFLLIYLFNLGIIKAFERTNEFSVYAFLFDRHVEQAEAGGHVNDRFAGFFLAH